jgi:hypothetical protein
MEHENAQILRAIADGKKVQYCVGTVWLGSTHYGPWEDFDSSSVEACQNLLGVGNYKWRIAPKTINIAGYEVPEPVREPLEEDTVYWVFSPFAGASNVYWLDTERDYNALKGGFVHLTKEAAEAHYEALKSFSASTK